MYRLFEFLCNILSAAGIAGLLSMLPAPYFPNDFYLGFVSRNMHEVLVFSIACLVIGFVAAQIAIAAKE